METPAYLIALHVFIEKHDRSFWIVGKTGIARPDKRKSVKGKIWFHPDNCFVKNGNQLVVCYKTGRKYFIHPGIRTRFK
jgi:hypothetical protein